MSTHSRSQRARFAQEASERKIADLEKQLEALCSRKTSTGESDLDGEIQKLAVELKKERQALKRKIQNAENQKKFRDSKKMKLNQLCNENPEIKRKLALRDAVGRPSLHQDQPDLMKAIADIAMNGGTTDANGGAVQSKRTLEELTTELNRLGFNISRSATYLRLLPRNASTTEGARHVNTVPVKLCRIQDSRAHPDGQFAATSVQYLETIATILGPLQTFFLSQYDKARVPLGVAAGDEQAPLLLHMDYRTKLPDREWMDAERRKLIPSVYAGIVMENGKIGQLESLASSGPTYIAIRSGQRSSPTAYMHFQDLKHVLNLEEFRPLAKTKSGLTKPVMIIIADGGPDESPRYEKVMATATKIFKENDLDGLFIATNAPDVKYHKIERRMAPLSREVSGLIIPHDHFLGSLLDMNSPADEDAGKMTFEAAGKIVAEVWSSMTVDGHPVQASYLEQDEVEETVQVPDGDWWSRHARESQYLLQITKCAERTCCSQPRSGLFQVLRERFLPPPLKVLQTERGLEASKKGSFVDLLARLALDVDATEKRSSQVPYDFECPSVEPLLPSRTCNICGLYHASTKSLSRHMKSVHLGEIITPTQRLIPKLICAERGNEVLCILVGECGYCDAEWRGNDEVEKDVGSVGLGVNDEVNKSKQCKDSSITKSTSNNVINMVNSWLLSAQAE